MSTTKQANLAIREKLDEPMDLVFDEEAFIDVRRQLEEQLGVNVLLDVSAIDDMLDSDSLVTSGIRGLRGSDALRIMLRTHNATWVIDRGTIRIISLDSAHDHEYFTREMIDVRELLRKIAVLESKQIADGRTRITKTKVVRKYQSGGVFFIRPQAGGFGGGGGTDDQENETEEASALPIEVTHEPVTAESILIDTILTSVANDSWRSTSMGEGTITCVGGVLIVNNTELIVDEVSDFVLDLEHELSQ